MKHRKAITKTAAAVLIVVIIAIAGIAAYFVLMPRPHAPKEHLFGLFPPFECPYFEVWLQGGENACKELGIDYIEAWGSWDPNKQANDIRSGITQGMDGAVICRVDLYASESILEECAEEGVAVVTTDGPPHKGPRVAHLASDDIKCGELIAQALIEGLKKSGKPKPWKIVHFEGLPGTIAAGLRKEGVYRVLNPFVANGDVIIVADEVANFDRTLAKQKMEAILSTTTDIDGVCGGNDDMALGAMKACEEAGLVPGQDVIFVGMDAIPEAQQAIKDGKMYATITQAPFLEAYWGVYIIYFYLEYGLKPDPMWIETPYFIVTQENVDTFLDQIQGRKPIPEQYYSHDLEKYRSLVEKYWGEESQSSQSLFTKVTSIQNIINNLPSEIRILKTIIAEQSNFVVKFLEKPILSLT